MGLTKSWLKTQFSVDPKGIYEQEVMIVGNKCEVCTSAERVETEVHTSEKGLKRCLSLS